jgi:hypothetical protein
MERYLVSADVAFEINARCYVSANIHRFAAPLGGTPIGRLDKRQVDQLMVLFSPAYRKSARIERAP